MAQPTRDLSKIPGFDERPSIDPESISALDDLLKQQQDAPAPDPKPDEKPTPDGDAKPSADETVPTPDEKPPAEESPKPEESKPTPDGEAKPKDEPAPTPSADDFDAIQLPPYTKPKSHEAFDKVKTLAREQISALQKERDELKQRTEELAAKTADGLPKEVETELKELREFRAKIDVEADPQFTAFDVQVTQNVESIYARLKAGGFTDEHLEQIKKLGGPGEVDWEKVSDKMPATLRRFVESKLVENEGLLDKKSRALEDAKKNASEYLKTKQNSEASAKETASKQVQQGIKELVPKLGWLEERRAKEGATAADKTAVETHNKLVKEANEFLADAAKDDSPQLRGILAIGYAQLLKLRVDHAGLRASSDAKIKELEGKLKESTELLDRVKKNSTTRFRESPAENNEPAAKAEDINTHGSDALDSLLKAQLGKK